MTDDMLHVTEWHNGDKVFSPFSPAEMTRRLTGLRDWMAKEGVDATLLTSHHGIAYFSGWLHRAFGRRYGMVITQGTATTISSGVDGGQAWRRSVAGNVTYTDWRRDNFYRAVRQLTPGVGRLAIEGDQTTLDFRRQIEAALPGVDIADAAPVTLQLHRIKSAEELALLRTGARIADLGIAAVMEAVSEGAPEHEIAAAGTQAMTRAIAAAFPDVELSDTWTWVQSGINTDGPHNPATNRPLRRGDILQASCFPMIFGYYSAVGRTAFLGPPDTASLALWERNLNVHRHGLTLLRPGAKCNEIAAELNDLYRQAGLLDRRSLGYGHSVGLMSHHYGRDRMVELREDVPTALQRGMVLSMEPMVMIPQGAAGAGGYREQDIVIVTPDGPEVITRAAMGPDHNIL